MGTLLGLVLGAGLLLLSRGRGRGRGGGGRPARRVPVAVGWWYGRTELLRRAGLPGRSGHLLAVQLATGLLAAAAVHALTGAGGIAACFGALGLAGPVALVRRAAGRRAVDRRELWPEVVDTLASGVRAGLSLPEALAALGERGPEPLRPAFAAFGADQRASGRTAESLDRLRERLADPVADRVVETVRLAREVGGNDVGVVLRTLSAFLRDDGRARAELEARQSWTVNAARLAVAAPWLVLLLLGTQRDTVRAYDTGAGTAILVTGGVACAVAYRLMVRIGRLPAERRVLR